MKTNTSLERAFALIMEELLPEAQRFTEYGIERENAPRNTTVGINIAKALYKDKVVFTVEFSPVEEYLKT